MSTGIADRAASRHRIRFGSETIDVQVRFGERDRLRISVHPDLRVTVDAPAGKAMEDVLERVKKRGGWILKQRQYFEQFMPRPPEKRYVSGETFYYLGRQYRLKVNESDIKSVKLIGRYFHLFTPDKNDTAAVRELLQNWYRTHAHDTFERRLSACLDVNRHRKLHRPDIVLRRMTRRWGSSSGNGRILLNTELVKAPVHCIDYVIMHELCHQRHPNHGKDFYRLLSLCMPDWEKRKERLERVV